MCSDHFTKDSFDESQELKRHSLDGNLKHILKPDAVPSLFPNEVAVNRAGSASIHLFICSKLSGNKSILSSFKQIIIKFWESIVFATEAVHRCSPK